MFSSKTPRDLNHDPEPWVAKPQFRSEIGRPKHHADTVDCAVYCVKEPRPEFDHVQHNAPNPILIEFREECERLGSMYPADWLRVCRRGFWSDDVTREHLDHARRVLTRLAQIGASA